jgi:hypothetical protein
MKANHQSTDSDRAVNGAGSKLWRRNHDLKSRTRRGTTAPQVQAAASRPSRDRTSVPHLWSIRPCSTTHPSPNLINLRPSARPETTVAGDERPRKIMGIYSPRKSTRRDATGACAVADPISPLFKKN